MTLEIDVRNLSNTAALLLALCLPSSQAGEQEYLLTGVIAASGGGRAFAVIEQADGQQRLVSEGDTVGDGRVAAIHAATKTVRLALPDGDMVLTLRGSAHAVEHREDYDIQDYQEVEPHKLNLDQGAVQDLLELSRQAPQLGEDKSRARLNELLGLSSDASIAAFNEGQVDSTAQLLEALALVLARDVAHGNHVGTIAVADDAGRRRLYLSISLPNTVP